MIHLNATTPEHTFTWPVGLPSYRPNSQCDWVIAAPEQEQVNIHFERFELEDADSSGQCTSDFLRLTDDDVSFISCHGMHLRFIETTTLQAKLYNSEGLGSQFIFAGGKSRVFKPYFYWVRTVHHIFTQ